MRPHPLARHLPEHARLAMATARYERDRFGRRRTRRGLDPLGVALMVLGVRIPVPRYWQVAEALVGPDPLRHGAGAGAPAGYDALRFAAQDFSQRWEGGSLRAEELPAMLGLDAGATARAVRWRAEGMGL